jgi:uncharacterized protein YjbJ (UPF0337 family)
MNMLRVKGYYYETLGKLKLQAANLTNNNLLYEKARKDELIGKMQNLLGKTKEEFRKIR